MPICLHRPVEQIARGSHTPIAAMTAFALANNGLNCLYVRPAGLEKRSEPVRGLLQRNGEPNVQTRP